jgi:hypothetical protein
MGQGGDIADRVGFKNPVRLFDLRVLGIGQAAGWYSLISPWTTVRRLNSSAGMSAGDG